MNNIDIALIKNNGFYDIAFENGDIKGVESFDTAITLSTFCERRADESEQPIYDRRRGWLGNLIDEQEGFEQGSKLWQLYQARATQDTANRAVAILQDAYSWLVKDGHLSNVIVQSELSSDNITLTISFIRSNNVVETKSFKLWENTGKNL